MVTTRGGGLRAETATTTKKREHPIARTSVLDQVEHAAKRKKTASNSAVSGKKGKGAGKKSTDTKEGLALKNQSKEVQEEKDADQPTNGTESKETLLRNGDQNGDETIGDEGSPLKNGHHDNKEGDIPMPDVDAVTQDSARQKAVNDSPILEKGLVYFFLRGKVNVEHPGSMDEVKRSYMVLRPLPTSAKLVDGKIKDHGKNRLVAIPKKKLPVKGYERFLTFIEEPAASLEVLRDKHLKGRTYQTKTAGERTDFPAQPVGEGVYAIAKCKDERQSHFAYILTLPEKPNELQQEFGLREKGSFIVSVKNPTAPVPPYAGVPDPPEYPKEIIEEFEGLRWGPLQPKYLDYTNTQILFISEKNFPEQDEHEGTANELYQLEEEDEKRVRHLEGSNSVFQDLELSKEFVGVQSTWG